MDETKNAQWRRIQVDSLHWLLQTPRLTTQYKAFYFSFSNGAKGYVQFAYGNLGFMVRVAPLGYTFYPAPGSGGRAVVASTTVLARNLVVSQDRYSIQLGALHSLHHDGKGTFQIVVKGQVQYDLAFTLTSEGFEVCDFGRASAPTYITHKIFPLAAVSGTYTESGCQSEPVTGIGTYIEALFVGEKFTNLGYTWTNFILRRPTTSSALTLLQYHSRSTGDVVSFASKTVEGKIVRVTSDAHASLEDLYLDPESGYRIPARVEVRLGDERLGMQAALASTTDVLSIFPKWAKDIVSMWSGAPYVFVYHQDVSHDGVEGEAMSEVTFIHKPPT